MKFDTTRKVQELVTLSVDHVNIRVIFLVHEAETIVDATELTELGVHLRCLVLSTKVIDVGIFILEALFVGAGFKIVLEPRIIIFHENIFLLVVPHILVKSTGVNHF